MVNLSPILGVGRDPQTAGIIKSYKIESVFNWVNNGTHEETLTIPDGNIQIFAVQISYRPQGLSTSSATDPRLRIFLNGHVVGQYALPLIGGSSSEWNVQDMIPYNYYISTANTSILSFQATDTGVGASGYAGQISITLYGIQK